ncbi:hypothetical protein LQ567_03520 [Niabella pedocola]|uniref:Bulb-type lectin domain-containing protein n=1 Tax=Niabella pedocola TaxID=1752077 RepID=A0ABS8PL36_9BACT|nr:hypothetical protein [Niabella pedocola]MCD2421815.1 hypothetical protein [Niabella pedocola]
MKKNPFIYLIFAYIYLLSPVIIQAQIPPAVQWQKSLGGSGDDRAYCIKSCSDGGYIVAGSSGSAGAVNGDVTGNHGSLDYWVVKLKNDGTIDWQKSLGGSGADIASAVAPSNDGGYIVAGYSNSTDGDVTGNQGGNDYWVVKLDAAGNIAWQKSMGGSKTDRAQSVLVVSDGYIVAGYSQSTDGDVGVTQGSYDGWVVKLDNSGNVLWKQKMGGPGWDDIYSIQATADGGFIVAGSSESKTGDFAGNHGSADYWIVKLDTNGNVVWQKLLGGTGAEYATFIQCTDDGGYIVSGYTNSANSGDVGANHGGIDCWIIKLDGMGIVQWQKMLGGPGNDNANCVQPAADGGYIIGGYSAATGGDVTSNYGGFDYWVIKLDATGTMKWQQSMGGTGTDDIYFIHPAPDGGYIIAGYSNSANGNVSDNHGNNDYWIIKLTSDHALPVTFGDISAAISNHTLHVHFTCLLEKNSDRFIIEASTNGTDFRAIGTVPTVAMDGNANMPTHYSLDFNAGSLGLAGIGLFGVLLLTYRRNRYLIVVVITCLIVSCIKKGSALQPAPFDKMYLRIVQVDKNGEKMYSRIVRAVAE